MQDKSEEQLARQALRQSISGAGSGHVQVGEASGDVVGSVVNHTHVAHLTIIQCLSTQAQKPAAAGTDGTLRPPSPREKRDVLLSVFGYCSAALMTSVGFVAMGALLTASRVPLPASVQATALTFALFCFGVGWLAWHFLAHADKKKTRIVLKW